jgi:hypothetical protein
VRGFTFPGASSRLEEDHAPVKCHHKQCHTNYYSIDRTEGPASVVDELQGIMQERLALLESMSSRIRLVMGMGGRDGYVSKGFQKRLSFSWMAFLLFMPHMPNYLSLSPFTLTQSVNADGGRRWENPAYI